VLVLALVAGGLALTLRGQAERQALMADSGRLGAQALLAGELHRSLGALFDALPAAGAW
jgi:hypothetical protein